MSPGSPDYAPMFSSCTASAIIYLTIIEKQRYFCFSSPRSPEVNVLSLIFVKPSFYSHATDDQPCTLGQQCLMPGPEPPSRLAAPLAQGRTNLHFSDLIQQ